MVLICNGVPSVSSTLARVDKLELTQESKPSGKGNRNHIGSLGTDELVQGPKAAVGRDNTWTGRVPRAEEWCEGNKVGVVREVDLSSL